MRLLSYCDVMQIFNGPPESMREHIYAASKAMKIGDWSECARFIINDKMDAKVTLVALPVASSPLQVWSLFSESDKVRDMIRAQIKQESLRTYLLTYSSVYDSLSIATLADMFDLSSTLVHGIVSKMIQDDDLMVSFTDDVTVDV